MDKNKTTPFDKIAWFYDLTVRLFGNPDKYRKTIKKLADLKTDGVALDVGGGTGLIAQYVAQDIKEMIVLDPSQKMLARIKSKKVKGVRGVAQKIPFPDKKFDVVYCVDSFHHFTNGIDKNNWDQTMDQCVGELLRVTKDGGVLIIFEFDPKTFRGKWVDFIENKIKKWGSRFYSREELANLFNKFEVKVSISSFGKDYVAKISKP